MFNNDEIVDALLTLLQEMDDVTTFVVDAFSQFTFDVIVGEAAALVTDALADEDISLSPVALEMLVDAAWKHSFPSTFAVVSG